MPPTLEAENTLRGAGCKNIAGVDEAGRGPLAGRVVAAAVVLPAHFKLPGLDDSKKLSDRARRKLFVQLTSNPLVHWAVAGASVQEIAALNILRATHLAMRRAIAGLPSRPCHALIDGLPVHSFPVPQTALVGGDRSSLSIAAASILAKVSRDDEMLALDLDYPQYGFAKHKGYGTVRHLEALRHHGPCPAHRSTFAPVAQAVMSI